MKRTQKIICLLLCALMILPLAACGETGDKPGSGTATPGGPTDSQSVPTETEPPTEMEKRASVKDSLPDVNFDGAQFRISTKKNYLYEISAEDITGDSINDALYDRNLRIGERFGIEIVPVITESDDKSTQISAVEASILAQDDAFELASTYVFVTGGLIMGGLYQNWLNMPYNDFSQPWWISGVNDSFRVQDALYAVTGDMCLSTLMLTYGVFYNLTRGEDYGLNDAVIGKVLDREWTFDYFYSVLENIYEDTNGDGQRGQEDFYGFIAENATNLDVYPFAFDIPSVRRDADGWPEVVCYSEKTVAAVDKITKLYWETAGSFVPTTDYNLPISMFRNAHALFTTTFLQQAMNSYRDMENDYIILPYPKWDESQQEYMTGTMDNYSVLGIPVTVSNTEMVSVITEALNVESYRTMFPTYYEGALQHKYARDPMAIEMLNLLMDGRTFDFNTLFSEQIGIAWLFRDAVNSKNRDYSSRYTKKEKVIDRMLGLVLDAYEENAKGN